MSNSSKNASFLRTISLAILSLDEEGRGVGYDTENREVRVPFALPNEKVTVRIYKRTSNFDLADLVSIEDPSPIRVQPKCPLFTECGGCQFQHMDYASQLKWKHEIVKRSFDPFEAFQKLVISPPIPSPQIYGYRSKLTPHFNRYKEGEDFPIGFLKVGRRMQLVDVLHCPIAIDSINQALPSVRQDVLEKAPAFKKGGTLLLRASADTHHASSRVIQSCDEEALERVNGFEFKFPAGDFFQNNPFILGKFVDYISEQALSSEAQFLVDVYCGAGLFSICLARHFEHVFGIEISERAIRSARKNAEKNGILNITFQAGRAEAIFSGLQFSGRDALVLLDPPRKGCDELFLKQLLEFKPCAILYVSCNVETQARDLSWIDAHSNGSYAIQSVQPFDLFPQTKHIESVAYSKKL